MTMHQHNDNNNDDEEDCGMWEAGGEQSPLTSQIGPIRYLPFQSRVHWYTGTQYTGTEQTAETQ